MAGLAIGRRNAKLRIDPVPRSSLNESRGLFAPVAGTWPVARVAGGSRRDVRGRLARRPCASTGVTSRTGARRTPKDAGGMTCFAANQFVR